MKHKIIKCPVCETPCTIEGIGDFKGKDKATTIHYESMYYQTEEKLKEAQVRIKKLEKAIKEKIKYCEKQNGVPWCKNCGLSKEDLK